jgi:N-dimethylarginine dimethylaminohydrolase
MKPGWGGSNMVHPLRRAMVCAPESAGWVDAARLDRWENLGFLHRPDSELAVRQHIQLCQCLLRAGVELVRLPAETSLSLDAVYTHDASLVTDEGMIILRPGKSNRRVEAFHHRALYSNLGIPILGEIEAPGSVEGGDLLWLDARTLLVGRSFRTNRHGLAQLGEILEPKGARIISAPLPYAAGPSVCLHLMSIVSLLDEGTALVDLPWLAVETVELLKERGYRFVEIDESERETLACNVLALGDGRLLALEENPKTNEHLRSAGFDVETFSGSEIGINGGGGPTCLTRPVGRW